MEGTLYKDDDLTVHKEHLTGTPLHAQRIYDPETGVPIRKYDFSTDSEPNHVALEAIALSASVQRQLETVVLDFVQHFKNQTNADNLCLAGGVALNSVLNGLITRDLGFENVFVPPYPGDEGIAIGCCAFGVFQHSNKVWRDPLTP